MKSVAQAVIGTVHVWAVPKNPDYDDLSEGPFKYETSNSGSYHWKTGAVCVFEQEVTINVPAGIDMVSMAFKTLNAAKVQAQVDYNQRIMEIDKQIHQLLMLTHQPDPDVEFIPAEDIARDPFDVVDTEVIEPEMVKDELNHLANPDDYRGADHE